MTDGSQEFCLRWNNHQATIISVFDYLLENETLVDCTLAAEGQYLKAHKVVLCACSPYLELLLSQHNDKHPILIFKDIKYNELKCMIEYMYKGEVNIAQDQLNHFLKAAESLQIKGLSESEEDAAPQTSIPAPRPPPPRAPPVQRTQPRPISSSVAVESPKRINRNEAASPTRKRRRLPIQGRPSLSGDDASNASESHLDQSNCDVPSNVQPSSDNAIAKLETNSELILEPKTEYDDNSVEDITLDDDEEDYSQAGTSMDNSQMNFSGWQGMDKSGGDEVFTGQDSGAQNSQEEVPIFALYNLFPLGDVQSEEVVESETPDTILPSVQSDEPGDSVVSSDTSHKSKLFVRKSAKHQHPLQYPLVPMTSSEIQERRVRMSIYECRFRREKGLDYFNYAGVYKPPRQMRALRDRCSQHCKRYFDDEHRQHMFDLFWRLDGMLPRVSFITKLMKFSKSRGKPAFTLNTSKNICRDCFIRTFDLPCKIINRALRYHKYIISKNDSENQESKTSVKALTDAFQKDDSDESDDFE